MRALVSLLLLLGQPPAFARDARGQADEVPTVAFCEMVKRPRLYFDKTVRTTATYQAGYEAAYLMDDRCEQGRRFKVGVGFVMRNDEERAEARRGVNEVGSGKYGNGRAVVTVLGILRDAPDRGFGGYRYRFDIIRFEHFASADDPPAVLNYEGELEAGKTYRATVRGSSLRGLSLVPAPRIAMHQAMSVEWTNLEEFPALRRLRGGPAEWKIVFTVTSDEVHYMGGRRWDRIVKCKMVRVE